MKTVIANKADFFPKDGCPIALRTIQGDYPVQHEGDLTDIRHTHDFSELIIITSGGKLRNNHIAAGPGIFIFSSRLLNCRFNIGNDRSCRFGRRHKFHR